LREREIVWVSALAHAPLPSLSEGGEEDGVNGSRLYSIDTFISLIEGEGDGIRERRTDSVHSFIASSMREGGGPVWV
jgi:hypothetical protein